MSKKQKKIVKRLKKLERELKRVTRDNGDWYETDPFDPREEMAARNGAHGCSC